MIRAIGKKVIVKPLYDKKMTAGGIHIVDDAVDRCDQGFIIQVGPEVKDLKVGQHVLFGGYNGTYVGLDGDGDLIFLEEDDCMCELFAPNTVAAGLYVKDEEGNYFSATIESAFQIIASNLAALDFFKKMRFKHKPMADTRESND